MTNTERARIERLIYGGDGLTHIGGATVFVPFVLPGEGAELRIVDRKKKFWRGEPVDIQDPSPLRMAPQCPYFTDCGGCQYQHATYEAQLQFKSEILRETLRRIGGIVWNDEIVTHGSPPWRYRNRAQWKVHESSSGAVLVGYMKAASHSICAVQECPILSPLLEETLRKLKQIIESDSHLRATSEIEAFVDDADSSVSLNVKCKRWPRDPVSFVDALIHQLPFVRSVLLQDVTGWRQHLAGPGHISYRSKGIDYRVSHKSFFQTNRFLVDRLAQVVADRGGSGDVILDLFSGVGLFSLLLSESFGKVIAVESNRSAVRDLQANASASVGRVEPIRSEVEPFLAACRERPDAIILDPPRAGLSNAAIEKLGQMSPHRIIYVSCDPTTLSRDSSLFVSMNYAISYIDLYDMFPQTYHIETVVTLERR